MNPPEKTPESYESLVQRVNDLERQLADREGKKDPWWSNLSIIAPVIVAIITGVVSWTTIQIEDRRQQEAISQKYLELAVAGETGPARRETLLSFYIQVVRDSTLRKWAEERLDQASADIVLAEDSAVVNQLEQLANAANQDEVVTKRAQENLNETLRLRAVEGLIASSKTVRWSSAQSLVTEFANDPELISNLLDFAERHLKNQLALYNVAAVLSDIRIDEAMTEDNKQDLQHLTELIQTYGGDQAKEKISGLR